jgi:N-methylhydantoinase A
MNEIFAALTNRVTERLTAAGFKSDEIRTERSMNMRYRQQVHVIATPITTPGPLTAAELDRTCVRFEEIYAHRYGSDAGYGAAGMEFVSFVVHGAAGLSTPEVSELTVAGTDPRAALVETRKAYFGEPVDAQCYDFERLRPGNAISGPAIIWTPITTIVVQPGQIADCDPYRNLILTWTGDASDGGDSRSVYVRDHQT